MTYDTLMMNFTYQNLGKYLTDNIKTKSKLDFETSEKIRAIQRMISLILNKVDFISPAHEDEQVTIFQWMRISMMLDVLLKANPTSPPEKTTT